MPFGVNSKRPRKARYYTGLPRSRTDDQDNAIMM